MSPHTQGPRTWGCAPWGVPTLTLSFSFPPPCSVSGGGKVSDGPSRGAPKKTKVEPYSLTAQQSSLIKEDKSNTKLWTEILKSLKDGPVSSPPGLGRFLCTVIKLREFPSWRSG